MILRKVWAHTVKTICLMNKNKKMLRLIPSILFLPFLLFSLSLSCIHTQPYPFSVIYTQPAPQFFALSFLNYLFSFFLRHPARIDEATLLLISGMGELLRAMLDLHLISLQPSSCWLFQSLSLQDTDASHCLFQTSVPADPDDEVNRKSLSDDIQSRRVLRMNENFKCLLCISKLMFHLGGYADQQKVLKLFIAGAERRKSTVLLLRYAPFNCLISSGGPLNVSPLANATLPVHSVHECWDYVVLIGHYYHSSDNSKNLLKMMAFNCCLLAAQMRSFTSTQPVVHSVFT